jgi:hypothetical protein
MAEPAYWYAQPATASVSAADFDKLFHVCEEVSRDFLYKIDRIDYREGILTTVPVATSQFFEPWRRDARTPYDMVESSIATTRRSIRFEFTKQPDETWQVAPKVLVERQAITEKRITSVVRSRSVLKRVTNVRQRPTGSREADIGVNIPERYWYALRRDNVFERAIAEAVQKRLTERG